MLVALLALDLFGGAPAGAQAEEESAESIRGTLIDKKGTRERTDDVPVEGAQVSVEDSSGEEVGTSESDAEGKWEVPVPGPGRYTVKLDPESLPDGVGVADGKDELELSVNPNQNKGTLFELGARARNVTTTFDRFLQLGFSGIRFGLIIAITSVGLSLIFGTTGLTNFAHGEMVTLGGIAAWYANVRYGLPFIVSVVIAVIVGAIAASLLERGVWRKLRNRGMGLLAMMVVSIGLSILLRYIFLFFFGGRSKGYTAYQNQESIEVGPVNMAPRDLWSIGLILIVLVLVALLLQRTKIGKAMRAVSDNRDLAASSGIDVDRVIVFVWALGGGLAALGGVLFALNERIRFDSGFALLLLMFAGITLGGLGTAYGALVGAFVLGLFIQISTIWIPSELKNAGALAVLALVLLVRPQGILGRAERIG